VAVWDQRAGVAAVGNTVAPEAARLTPESVQAVQSLRLPHRQVGPVVRGHQQNPVGQRQRPLPALDPVGDLPAAPPLDLPDQPPERPGPPAR
jgi:hypothetical protein